MNTEIPFEQELEWYFGNRGTRYYSMTKQNTTPDFVLLSYENPFWLEAKEKRQRTKMSAWPKVKIPEEHLFIVDELTVRRLMQRYPYAGIVVRDNIRRKYHFISAADLLLAPKLRVQRQISELHPEWTKGKWMLDLRYFTSGSDIVTLISNYAAIIPQVINHAGPFGVYAGEEPIPYGGEMRTKEHKKYDMERNAY